VSEFQPQPDYRRFVNTMWRREVDRVPIAELGIDMPIKEQFLGKPVTDVKTDVEFWYRAGYDYIYLRPAYEFPHTIPSTTNTGRPQYGESQEEEPLSTSLSGPGVIAKAEDLESYDWPNPDNDAYYAPLREAVACLPQGMGLVSGVGGIFTRTWMMMGLEPFCFALAEEPELIAEIFRRVGTIQCKVLRRVLKEAPIVAVWYGDDLAYADSTMVSPRVYRKYLFPWMEELAKIAHDAGLPFIFHSDGKVWDVIPDLISVGVNALHPIEPKAMDINVVKATFGDKLALIGNIDMNLLGLGTPEQVREQVRQRIKDLGPGGGYAVGANPGIAHYVRLENYNAMRQAAFEFGRYPIEL
jgi:uroporphyrinogen decarboxylase